MAFNPNAFSAPGGSSTFQTLTFANSNGVSFSNSNGSVVATVKTDYQTSGAYLTTARASNDAVGLNTALTANGVAWTVNSSGISLNVPAFLTTAMQSNAATISNINVSAGTTSTNASAFTFANANGVSFGLGTGASVGSITASHNGITTGRASNDAVGLAAALTAGPLAWTVNSAGISLNAGSAAGTTSGFTGGASISGSMTHNTAGLAVSLSHPAWITTAMLSNAATLSAINVSAGTTSSNQSSIGFSNANGLSFGFSGASLTGSYTVPTVTDYFSKTNTTFNGANISGSITNNTAGLQLSLSVAAPGAGGGIGIAASTRTATTAGSLLFDTGNGITFGLNAVGGSIMTASHNGLTGVSASASNGSFGFQTLNFSNANNVTFGTSAGSIITASVAAPGAAAENNWVNLLGANTAGNTTASGSTIGYSGINLTLSGTNGSVMNISAPATSSLSATGGLSISTNGSTISMGNVPAYFFEPVPMLQSGSTTYLPGIGTWHFQPMYLPLPIGSGRVNGLYSFGSTSNLLAASNGTSFQTGTTGGASYSFALSKSFAFYSLGAGANSTRLESFYNATWSMGASHSMGITVTNASQITGQRQASIAFIASIDSNGATTGGGLGGTHAASFANSSTATSAYTSGLSSIYNYLSGAMLIPIPFVTTLNPGMYWVAEAYSTAVTTAGSTNQPASIWPMVNQVAFYGIASMSHRQFGKTASSTGSQYMPGKGIFSVVSVSPPVTVGFSDIRSLASNQFNYYNIIRSGMTV
jgi:hypothetical protein